jgi:proline racemase
MRKVNIIASHTCGNSARIIITGIAFLNPVATQLLDEKDSFGWGIR